MNIIRDYQHQKLNVLVTSRVSDDLRLRISPSRKISDPFYVAIFIHQILKHSHNVSSLHSQLKIVKPSPITFTSLTISVPQSPITKGALNYQYHVNSIAIRLFFREFTKQNPNFQTLDSENCSIGIIKEVKVFCRHEVLQQQKKGREKNRKKQNLRSFYKEVNFFESILKISTEYDIFLFHM